MAAASPSFAGLVGTWTIDTPPNVPGPEKVGLVESTEESVFDPDWRVVVDKNDYQDGGKYRSIVKLQMRYTGQPAHESTWYMGTGWLIRPDLLVTAGHNVFNWSGGSEGKGLGRASIIRCHIGYSGKGSVGTPTVQTRVAKRIVTTAEWVASKDNRNRDFSFIQVDRPFEGDLRLFSYKPTPKQGEEMIGVVGYPGDKSITDDEGREERGAQMYEDFQPVSYNLNEVNNTLHMLKYRISTYGGQSGAPVIRRNSKQVGIGTHVYGLGDKNQASPIGAQYGNDYDAFVGAFNQEYPKAGEIEGVSLVKPPTAPSAGAAVPSATLTHNLKPSAPIQSGFNAGNQSVTRPVSLSECGFQPTTPYHSFSQGGSQLATTSHGLNHFGFQQSNYHQGSAFNQSGFHQESQEESFLDVLKSVGRVAASVGRVALPFASPLLGPLGGPISAVAGAALGAVAHVCAESGEESAGDYPTGASDQAADRAILAEATLQAVFDLDPSHPVTEKVLNEMRETYTTLAPNVKLIAPKLTPGLLSGAYKMAVDKNYIAKNQHARNTLPARSLQVQMPESASSSESGDFVQAMLAPTKVVEGEEAFFDSIGSVFLKGLQYAKPLLRVGAKKGFEYLNGVLAESALEEATSDDPDIHAAEIVAKRAVVAEAALQAIMKLKKHELASVPFSNLEDGHEESLVDFIKVAAQKIGKVVKDTAPAVINAVVPVILRSIKKKSDRRGPRAPGRQPPALKKKPSVLSMVNGSSGAAVQVK